MLRFTFQFQLLGFFNHRHDLLIFTGSICLFYTDCNFSFFNNRSCIDRASLFLTHRNRLSGKGCLVHHRLSICYHTIKRNYITHMNPYQILRLDCFRGNLNFLSILYKPDLIDI